MTTMVNDPKTKGLFAIVGFLVCVELASGILQGYYTPIFSDIADHLGIADADVNWFEAAQLIVSALVVPPLAREHLERDGAFEGVVPRFVDHAHAAAADLAD